MDKWNVLKIVLRAQLEALEYASDNSHFEEYLGMVFDVMCSIEREAAGMEKATPQE